MRHPNTGSDASRPHTVEGREHRDAALGSAEFPEYERRNGLRDYENVLRTGVPFADLVAWLGKPIPGKHDQREMRGYLVVGDPPERAPLEPLVRWDCMNLEGTFREIMEARRNPEMFNILLPESLQSCVFVLHPLLQCAASRKDDLWIVQSQCLKHATERLEETTKA
jgi:hypothetical protein